MGEVNATGAYAGRSPDVAGGAEAGMVRVGDVTLSAADAAEFVMLHRTQVMKQVGADRTEMAQRHLARIREARKYLGDLIDLKKFGHKAHSYKDRIPVTPDMVRFLNNEVGCSTGERQHRVVYYHSAVASLPESVRRYYGFDEGGEGTGGTFKIKSDGNPDTHGRFQIGNVTVVSKDDMDSLKEEVDNYIDQQNDSNNLFMTKFKNVVNSMNEAFEGANSMADKSHETLRNLLSRW